MQNTFIDRMKIFSALLQRDLKILKSELFDLVTNSLIQVGLNALLFGYLLPAMGIKPSIIGPMYLGIVMLVLYELGFAISANTSMDLAYNRFIDYQATFSLPKRWLFAEYLSMFVIKAFVISVPAILVGTKLLGNRLGIIQTNWPLFFIVYFIATIFLGLLFLYLAMGSSFEWFNDNVWPRCLSPIVNFGCVFFTWKMAYSLYPFLGYILLLNPMTYICEGVRSTIIGGNQFIDARICIAVLIGWSIVFGFLLNKAVTKRLDLM